MAKIILMDWQRGKIPYFAQPPEDSTMQVEKNSTQIVGSTEDKDENKKVRLMLILY
jgi:hypothetical protein